ncbi:hypothetical protein BDC45DRAFT_611484 [Circinella umbellata]|nr:hypothetical protein BDC45DRAFT_611484 [Circinella umbellata]
MALPAKELETPVCETGTAPSTTFVSPTPVLTWARVVQAEHVPLVHVHQQNNDNDPKAVIYHSRVWRVGHNSGSVIFDINVGINRDPQTKAYMGTGFAVLDIQEYNCLRSQQNNQGCFKCGDKTHFADTCPFAKAKEQWIPGGSKCNCHKINSSSKDPSSSLLKSKHTPASKPKQPPNKIPPPTGNSGTMVIDELTDSEEYCKLGYIEQKMDEAILSFINIDHNQTDENIREQARLINLDHN